MKFMVKLETIIMNRTGCNRETANLVANDILSEVDKVDYTEKAEVRCGKWLPAGTFDDFAKCSVCGLIEHSLNEVYSRGTYNYCPNCGAKMNGRGE